MATVPSRENVCMEWHYNELLLNKQNIWTDQLSILIVCRFLLTDNALFFSLELIKFGLEDEQNIRPCHWASMQDPMSTEITTPYFFSISNFPAESKKRRIERLNQKLNKFSTF